MPPPEADLGEAELEVLKVLWEEGPQTVRQVHTTLHTRGRTIAYTTVLTFLTRLEQKGFVHSDKSEMAYLYQPTISRDGVVKSRLKSFLEQLYDGAAGPLVLQLIKEEKFTSEEIAELQGLIDGLDAAGPPKRKPKRRRREG